MLLKTEGALTAGVNLAGYLPSLGAPGYTDRRTASSIAGTPGSSVADGALWPSDIGGTTLQIVKAGGPTIPNPGLVDASGLRFTTFSGGTTGWSHPDIPQPTDKTYVLRTLGVGTNAYLMKVGGFVIASTATGWTVSTRDANATPTVVCTITGALNTPGAIYVILLSVSAAGALRFIVQKNLTAPVVGTATGVVPGTDTSYWLGAGAYGTGTTTQAVNTSVRWARVITPGEETAVLTALGVAGLNIIASDTFTRADAAVAGTAETGQPWVALSGTWAISSNQLLSSTANGALLYLAAQQADCRLQVTLASVINAALAMLLIGRESDANNFVALQLSNTTLTIIQRISATSTTLATYTLPSAPAIGDTYWLDMSGTTLTAYRNGVQVAQGTTTRTTGINVGFRTSGGGGAGTAWRVDNFAVQPAG